MRLFPIFVAAFAVFAGLAKADAINVAVAANFRAAAEDLGADFHSETGHWVRLSAGSTGLLYAQISRGAPFDVLLAADQTRPEALVKAGLGVAGTRYTYATGRLVFIVRDPDLIGPDGPRLDAVRTLSIANPKTAPYGAAALQTIQALGGTNARIANAQNVAGVVAAVVSGAADGGFAARSLLAGVDQIHRWDIAPDLHQPIRQDAVLLARSADNATARAFLTWMRAGRARSIIEGYGYGVD